MDKLIPFVNQLQDSLASVGFNHEKIDLPLIAVVGAQSVGKSSILEALVGKDFLPRGNGIVTRRPLLLQLRTIREKKEYGEFGHFPGKVFTDFAAIRQEIIDETDRVTGGEKKISPDPIFLKIFSSKVIDLSLVDLPGIIKVPVGNQPSDIEAQVKEIVLQYIRKANCIILAVTAANTDLANSDSLMLARQVDPEGIRTIGVITKCDALEEGLDAHDSLMGIVYRLKLGFFGVVCRTQRQSMENKSIEESLRDEEAFFANHSRYRLLQNSCGTRCLSIALNQILLYHIIDSLPDVKVKISNLLYATEKELAAYGEPICSHENPGTLLLNFFTRFSRYFEDAVDGKSPCQALGQLTGGARINYIFHDWYTRILREFNPLNGLTDLEIRTTIRNTAGPKVSLFVPEAAFELLVKRQILHLESPSLKCVEQVGENVYNGSIQFWVYVELQAIVEKCDLPEMKRYAVLREHILEVVHDVLEKLLEPANKMIKNVIQMQTAYINANHPDFMHNVIKSLALPSQEPGAFPPSANGPDANGRNYFQGRVQNIDNRLKNGSPMKFDSNVTSGAKIIRPTDSSLGDVSPSRLAGTQSSGIFGYFLKDRTLRSDSNSQENGGSTIESGNTVLQRPKTLPVQPSPELNFWNKSGNIDLPCIPTRLVPSDSPSDREALEEKLIKSLIHTYFCIVRQSVADIVPKAIMYFLVNSAKEIIPRELVTTLYKDALFTELLREGEHVVEKRHQLKEMQKNLRRAVEILNSEPEDILVEYSRLNKHLR
ncbi:dynamin-related protein DRPA [Cardiosporidium cionae]|uniref:Dynamin-related protein DRPA n=1 Tax=Cardiosporidium cionae TaxID=476202 RepID=A0ABQ7JCA9_9APIC|nr:dynamin-related protein DRPA [Cardiosporidium cionae]|eukprot:KAF8821611.1 dynamin-related protein DRPA [Cardiosporidium cionae]